MSPPPAYLQHRMDMFDVLKKKYDATVAAQPRELIQVTLPDGSVREGKSFETSPMDIARDLAKSLADRAVIAEVDGQLWDLTRPLEKSCKLAILDWDSPNGAFTLFSFSFFEWCVERGC